MVRDGEISKAEARKRLPAIIANLVQNSDGTKVLVQPTILRIAES